VFAFLSARDSAGKYGFARVMSGLYCKLMPSGIKTVQDLLEKVQTGACTLWRKGADIKRLRFFINN